MVKTQKLSFLTAGEDGLKNITGLVGGLEDKIKSLTAALTRVKTTVKTVKTEAARTVAAFDTLEKLSGSKTTTTVTTETRETGDPEALGNLAREVAGILTAAVGSFAAAVEEKLKSFAAWGDGGITAGLMGIVSAVGAVQALLSGDSSMALWLGSLASGFLSAGGEVKSLAGLLLQSLLPAVLSLSAGGGVIGAISAAVASLTGKILGLSQNWGSIGTVAASVWGSVKAVWGAAAGWFQKSVFTPLGDGLRLTVNVFIGMLNVLIMVFFGVINGVISALNLLSVKVPDWVPVLGGKTFGFQLKKVPTPEIPYLAKGAVLPANKPFLAMVGDQTHGTNVEAPLSTIQEAVSLVMGEQTGAIMAGFEASLGVQKEILEAVLGIQIGDSTIAQAVHRYEKKLSVIRGGGV